MKVVHITNNDFDGAGRAVLRLNNGLREIDVNSIMVVLFKRTISPHIYIIGTGISIKERMTNIFKAFIKFKFDIKNFLYVIPQFIKWLWQSRFKLFWKPKSLFNFNSTCVSYNKLRSHFSDADVICFHSIQNILTSSLIEKISQETKAVLFFHPRDMEPLTGGCHFNFGCDKYIKSCGNCPQLKTIIKNDFSYSNLKLKKRNYKNIKFHLIASNSFVKKRIQKSLFKNNIVSLIYMGIETTRYTEIDKNIARQDLKLPLNEKIILFGCFNANDKRKGAHLLKEALQNHFLLYDKNKHINNEVRLVTFGMLNGYTFDGIPIKWTHMGQINSSEKMNSLYRSADVLVSPSIDDLGPTIIQEAFMNELPIIAFNLGLAVDFIIDGVNGFCIPCFDVKKFGWAIKSILQMKLNKSYSENKKLVDLSKQCTLEYEANAYMKAINFEYHDQVKENINK